MNKKILVTCTGRVELFQQVHWLHDQVLTATD